MRRHRLEPGLVVLAMVLVGLLGACGPQVAPVLPTATRLLPYPAPDLAATTPPMGGVAEGIRLAILHTNDGQGTVDVCGG